MRRRYLAAVLSPVLLGSLLAVPATAAPATGSPGSAGANDPYFPRQGNGGYDATSYDLQIGYLPATKQLTGYARVQATATMSLSRFDLDLRRNLVVSSVTVDGQQATFSQPAAQVQELVISPARVLPAGHDFTVVVRYAGTAKYVLDPDGSPDGFIPTNDGAFVASEPQGSPTWFPVNDTPRDKATYRVGITVPKGLSAISNGELTGIRHQSRTTTWQWQLDRPVSSYLITATLGKFDLDFGKTAAGIPYVTAYDPTEEAAARPVVAKLPAIVDYFSTVYGRYPFGQAGAIIDHAPKVGYALETATRPVFDSAPDVLTLAHELAHQWYGDDVTLSRWRDIWINEGFAEFSSWLWDEHSGGMTAAQHFKEIYSRPASDGGTWQPPPGNPGSGGEIFSGSVYDRGAATLQALRQKVGDAVFFRIMRGWVQAKHYGNAQVPEFTTYAAKIAHVDLTHFFDVWLYRPKKPWS